MTRVAVIQQPPMLLDRGATLERAVPSPLRLPSAAECVRFERESFGALHQMMAGLDPAQREAAWDEVLAELSRFETAGGFVGPCEMLVAVATKEA